MTDEVEVKETAGDKALRLNRIKNASEAYAELKALNTDPLTEEVGADFPSWPTFRDEFIADWTNNRTIVTEKEADAMFDEIVETAVKELETIAEVAAPQIVLGEETAPVVDLAATVNLSPPKKARKKAVPGATSYLPATAKVLRKLAKKKVAKKAVRKVAAKKKVAGKGKMDLARATYEKYSGKWTRQEILTRMVEVNGLSPAYASTAYQILKSE
jgi:hypothetical protein